eukprot:TRINITY_DN30551_c0_g1_i1.p1 TRINITY_DN30551_c0_g1~~TRINITY_DN30551_c0_g1_i1.p1  ORF type:complete len:367 (+),score=14.35 TRINITY_DN30551_c0_g1_i1:98-1198(+)
MSFDNLPEDALRVILEYLDSRALAHVMGCSTALYTEGGKDCLWTRACGGELGVHGGRAAFLKIVRLESVVFIGQMVVPYTLAGGLKTAYPELAREYQLTDFLIDPLPVKMTFVRSGDALRCDVGFYRLLETPLSPQSDLERAFLSSSPRSELSSHTLRHTMSFIGTFDCGKIQLVEPGTSTELKGEVVGWKGVVGAWGFGGFFGVLEGSKRDYSMVRQGVKWRGKCYQNNVGPGDYPMSLDVTQSSANSGITQGTVEFPTFSAVTRFAGITGIAPTDPCPTPNTPRGAPIGSTDEQPPLCTLFSTPPLRPLHHRFTRFTFTEYQHIEKGGTVVPTRYSAVVVGDTMIGVYHDTRVCNHGVFYLAAG